jgi:hypothetical protein
VVKLIAKFSIPTIKNIADTKRNINPIIKEILKLIFLIKQTRKYNTKMIIAIMFKNILIILSL